MAKCCSLALVAVLGLCAAVWPLGTPAQSVSIGLAALANVDRELSLLRSGVVAKQVSSWDRRHGNGDFNNFVSAQPDGTVVLFDEPGPGCLYRIWMTGINNNELSFFFDDEEQPRVRTRLQDFFNNTPGFPKPLALNNADSSGGWTSYVPIPFARRLRIVSKRTGIQNFYYNFTYHRYAEGTEVTSYRADADPTRAVARWQGTQEPSPAQLKFMTRDRRTLEAGRTLDVLTASGAGVVRGLTFNRLPDDGSFLRAAILRVYYDGNTFPSVECPLGDFVGSPFVWSRVRALMFQVEPDAHRISVRWPMPFRKGIRITLTNEGAEDFPVGLSTTVEEMPVLALDGSGYFHAQFRLLRSGARDGNDLIFLERSGRGHFVGCVQSVEGARGLYFLEGDERVYVDDDAPLAPSLYGTGTEDYFNGGWYFDRGAFTTPTHGAPLRQNNGVISMYRLHPSDVIPFAQRLTFGMEHGHDNEAAEKYGLVAFWYQSELQPIASQLGSASERRFSGRILTPVKRETGMIEAQSLRVIEKTPGLAHELQPMAQFGEGWLDDNQLWIPRAGVGEKLILELPVEQTGRYRLRANFTRARDYGRWRMSLGEKKLIDLDLYDPAVISTGEVDLGTHELTAGGHRLTLECLGTNAASVGHRFMGGLDYVWLTPVK